MDGHDTSEYASPSIGAVIAGLVLMAVGVYSLWTGVSVFALADSIIGMSIFAEDETPLSARLGGFGLFTLGITMASIRNVSLPQELKKPLVGAGYGLGAVLISFSGVIADGISYLW